MAVFATVVLVRLWFRRTENDQDSGATRVPLCHAGRYQLVAARQDLALRTSRIQILWFYLSVLGNRNNKEVARTPCCCGFGTPSSGTTSLFFSHPWSKVTPPHRSRKIDNRKIWFSISSTARGGLRGYSLWISADFSKISVISGFQRDLVCYSQCTMTDVLRKRVGYNATVDTLGMNDKLDGLLEN